MPDRFDPLAPPPPKTVDELGLGHLTQEELIQRMDYEDDAPATPEEISEGRRHAALNFANEYGMKMGWTYEQVIDAAAQAERFLKGGD